MNRPAFTSSKSGQAKTIGGTSSRIALVLLLLVLLLPAAVTSQLLPFKTYTVKDGLLSNNVGAICQDSWGNMWFGTTDGISIFDGKSFRNFTIQNGLPKNSIMQLFEDRLHAGAMWILAGGHVVRFADGKFTTYGPQVGAVNCIFQDHAGAIWWGTNIGVMILEGEKITQFHSDMLDTNIVTVAETSDGVMWFGADKYIVSYSPRTGAYQKIGTHGSPEGIIWSMFPGRDGNLYVGLDGGSMLQLRTDRIVHERSHLPATTWLAQDDKDNLWSGGYTGIQRIPMSHFADAPVIAYTVENGLPENTTRSIFVDREDNLWVGGRDKGVSKLSERNVYRFSAGEIAAWAISHDITFASSDAQNHIWLLADNMCGEYWQDQYGAWHVHRHALARSQAAADALLSLTCDARGRLWVQCGGWPGRFECYDILPARADTTPSTLQRSASVDLWDELHGYNSLQFIVDDASEIWQSFGQLGIVKISPASAKHVMSIHGEKEGVPTQYIRALARDRLGNIWGGGLSSGVVKLPRDTLRESVKRFGTEEGLPDQSVWCLMEDKAGNVLVGTANGGLGIIEGGKVRTISAKNGLPSNSVQCMAEDSSGRLWLGTSIGMVYEDSPGSKIFIRNQAFIGSTVYNCGVTGNGLVWFVTSTDLFVFDSAHEIKDTTRPPIRITGFRSNGNPLDVGTAMVLSHDENNCEISYIGISFKDEGSIRYQYRLASTDKDWQGPTSNNSITYGHLDPGAYVFQVKAINIDGIESRIPATMAITILPPFWQTSWFYLIVGIIVALVGPVIYWRRTAKLREGQRASQEFSRRLIESQEMERKRVAGELHDGLGQELIVIANRAQMALRKGPNEKVEEQILGIAETASRAIENVRDIAFNLSPYHLEQLGLTESVKSMITKVSEASEVRFTLDIDQIDHLFFPETEINVYRIIQECINNILKHAQATTASVTIRHSAHSVRITVYDDGKGFDVSKKIGVSVPKGYGLTGLAERIKVFGGSLRVDSVPDGGSTIRIILMCPAMGAIDQKGRGST